MRLGRLIFMPARFERQGDAAFNILEHCSACGAQHFGWFPDGSASYPVERSQCASCGAMTCSQEGPPMVTMS